MASRISSTGLGSSLERGEPAASKCRAPRGENSYSEKSAEVGRERTKHALIEEVGEGGGLVVRGSSSKEQGVKMKTAEGGTSR